MTAAGEDHGARSGRRDPGRLDEDTARGAMAAAERGYEHCQSVFGKEPSRRIQCDLTPRFYGATGFAMPENHSDPNAP